MKLKKYNLKGEEVGEVEVSKELLPEDCNSQMVKDYIVALRANARQWSANTRGRSEVNHSTKKPHRQKGTGNARQGRLSSPQYKGGGVVFGPKPKFDQHVRINKKERRAAIRFLFAEKVREGSVAVLENSAFQKELKKPSTKKVASFLKCQQWEPKRVAFVGGSDADESGMKLSVRNLERCCYLLGPNVNGYDLMCARKLILSESALEEMTKVLT